ncbi:hypothetical protein [Nocardia alni]|uniref:hypothetical protein n=1 Tax=Nocardia alni TaxID=2815723 RepID=UPI001C22ED44|nr:hypothetical protein [Nocardia alni]
MAGGRTGAAGLILAGAVAGPLVGGQVALLRAPLGGVLGVPGDVVGYIGAAAVLLGCATAVFESRWRVGLRGIGVCAVLAGVSMVIAGTVDQKWVFTAAVLCAGASTGPVLVRGRISAWREPPALTGWQVASAAGVASAAASAAACASTPGAGLAGAGAAVLLLGLVVIAKPPATQWESGPMRGPRMPWRYPPVYVAVGFVAGGAVLPALHLLLFRWNVLDRDQALLLLPAAVLAVVAVAIPGPRAESIAPLLVLASGGSILVATAPGPVTSAIGIAVVLAAAARALRGLDLVVPHDIRAATATLLAVVAGGGIGLVLVSVPGQLIGAGNALTILAIPTALAALLPGRLTAVSAIDAAALEGGTP